MKKISLYIVKLSCTFNRMRHHLQNYKHLIRRLVQDEHQQIPSLKREKFQKKPKKIRTSEFYA